MFSRWDDGAIRLNSESYSNDCYSYNLISKPSSKASTSGQQKTWLRHSAVSTKGLDIHIEPASAASSVARVRSVQRTIQIAWSGDALPDGVQLLVKASGSPGSVSVNGQALTEEVDPPSSHANEADSGEPSTVAHSREASSETADVASAAGGAVLMAAGAKVREFVPQVDIGTDFRFADKWFSAIS